VDQENKKTTLVISTGTIIKIIVFIALTFALIKLKNLVLVVLTSIVIASFVESAVYKSKKYIKNRTFAVFLIYFLSLSLLGLLMSVFVPVFVTEMSLLVSEIGKYVPSASLLNTFQGDTIEGARGVVTSISSNSSLADIIQNTKSLMDSFSGGFFTIFGNAFGGILNFVLIIVISFYLSIKEKGVEGFLRIVTPLRHEEYVIGLWRRTERKIGLWIQGQMLLGIIIGVLTYLGLVVLGVKYALVIAIITALAELIPFGMFLAVIPAVVFGYFDGGVSTSLMVLGLYIIIQQFENYLIYPLVVKKVLGISPLIVILSLLIGAELAGFWGIILAIPCATCLLEFLDDLEKKKIISRSA
jgi:predicted PurR-regulated permease PerM